jgi:GntR family transcriptional regulator/MocR family aminotransferase
MSREWTISGLDLHVETRRAARRTSLEDSLREAVRDGRLSPGERLPSSRSLAEDLGLSRGTVSAAYDQLVAEGYLVARQGAGTTVATVARPRTPAVTQRARPAPTFDLRPGTPDVEQFPTAVWLRCARKALNAAHGSTFGYGDPRGRPELRRALTEYLGRTRGVLADPDRIVVTTGTTQSLSLLCAALRRAGHPTLGVEDPCFSFHRAVAGWAGTEVAPVPVDDHGVRADLLGSGDLGSVRAVLVTPAHQYPTGVTMHPQRRHDLATWASDVDGLVIEDDYDGEFRYDRQPVGALQGMAPGNVAYLGSASKALSPGLRLGWMVLPERWVDPVREAKRFTDLATDAMSQLTLAELIDSHAYDRQVRAGRARYRLRRDLLLREVEQIRTKTRRSPVHGVSAGLQALVRLPQDGPAEQVYVERARAEGLAIEGLAQHWQSVGEHHPKGLVVGFGHPSDRAYPAAVAMLGRVLADTLDQSA